MVRTALLVLLTLGLTVAGQAQSVFRWQQAYGTAANEAGGRAVAVAGGGYLLTGTQERLGGLAADLYFVRTDVAGNVLSTKTTPLAKIPKVVSPLVTLMQDGTGHLIISGSSNGTTQDPRVSFVAKLTAAADTAWVWRYITPANVITFLSQPLLTNDGNYVVSANLNSSFGNFGDYHLLKFDAGTGTVLWDRPLTAVLSSALANRCRINHIQRAGNGFIAYIDGRDSPGATGTATGTLLFDENGLLLRQRTKRTTLDGSPSVSIIDRNGSVVGGGGQSLTKLTAQGDTVWHTVVPSAYQYRTWGAKGLVQEAGGGYAVLGESRYQQPGGGANVSSLHLVRFSATGQLLADSLLYRPQDTFGGSLLLSATGEYVFSGYTATGPLGGSDLLLAQVRRVGPLAVRSRSLLAAEALGVYPNPATGTQDGRLPRPAGLPGAATVQVLDAVGRVAWRGALAAGAAELALPTVSLRPGLYVVQLTAPDGRRWTGRWLRQ